MRSSTAHITLENPWTLKTYAALSDNATMSSLNVKPKTPCHADDNSSGTEQAAVFQLLYISAAVHEFTEEELTELLEKARDNNKSMGVSGMLLYHEGSFIQALEGDEQAVNALYNKIAEDKRHTETYVMFKGMVKERDFEGWSMGFYRSNQSSAENLEGFHNFMANGFRSADNNTGSSARQAILSFREGMQADCVGY